MHSTLALTGVCLSAALAVASPLDRSSSYNTTNVTLIPDFHLPPQNLTFYGNNSLFSQWRTKARFRPSSNHIGDPTAFWQDEEGVFHVSGLYGYLRGPNISITSSIGGALTTDFLSYVDVHNYTNASLFENGVEIGPGNKNDPLAVFDGSVIPKGYKGKPTLVYTGVHYLPISWSKPYIKGSEVQALAYSEDNGATWIKPDIDPVIPGPPEGFNVTGFRDPWVFQAPQFSRLLNDTPETWYLSVSSGIKEVGPRLLLYRQNSSDFTSWEFLGPSVSTPVNTTFSTGNFSGNDGSNYETSNTLFLDEDGQNLENGVNFVTMGAESGRKSHSFHYSLWKMGEFVRSPVNESVILEDHATGVLDWGLGYACSTIPDYKTNRRLAFCWSNDDFNSSIAEQVSYRIGSGGLYSIPRELYYKEIEGVVADDLAAENGYWSVATEYLNTTLAKDGVAMAKANGNDTVTLATLGCKPAREILEFRKSANHSWTEFDFEVDVNSITSNRSGVEITKEKGVTLPPKPLQPPLGTPSNHPTALILPPQRELHRLCRGHHPPPLLRLSTCQPLHRRRSNALPPLQRNLHDNTQPLPGRLKHQHRPRNGQTTPLEHFLLRRCREPFLRHPKPLHPRLYGRQFLRSLRQRRPHHFHPTLLLVPRFHSYGFLPPIPFVHAKLDFGY
jgi:beta-fructofuranosidase